MGRRTLLLIASVLVAILGTGLVYAYVQNVRNDAAKVNEPVQVLVATAQIPAGTTAAAAVQSGALAPQSVPRSAAGAGALSTTDSINSLVALYPIFPGQQIIASQWGSSASTSSLTIPDGKIAGSFQLGDPQRVAGFVNPGSTVAVFLTVTNPADETRVLLAKVPVIGVGPSTVQTRTTGTTGGQQNTEQIPTAILTLALTQSEMQKMVLASTSGTSKGMWFALVGPTSNVTTGPGTGIGDLFS
jgi:pilus assembly protein CpaB